MVKEKRILSYTVGYLLVGLFICLIGISNVFADTYENIGYLNDYSDVLVEVSYTGSPLPLDRTDTYQLEQVEAMNIHVSNFTFASGITYSIEFSTPDTALSYANAFTVTGIDSNNNSISCATVGITYDDIKYLNFKFNCSSNVNELYLRIFNSSNNYIMDTGIFSWSYVYLRRVTSSTDTSILESQNSQIIQGQEDIKDTIKDELNSCRDSINLAYNAIYSSLSYNWATLVEVTSTEIIKGETYTISVYIDSTGDSNAYWNETDGYIPTKYFTVKQGLHRYTYTFTALKSGTNIGMVLSKSGLNGGDSFTLTPSKIQIEKGNVATKYEEPNSEVCINKIDETNDKLDNLTGAITDDSQTDMSGLEDSIGWLPPGPVDSILNLPLALFNSLSNNLSNKTCISVELELPFVNKNITLPCVKTLYDKMGVTGTLFQSTGIIASCFILFNYLIALYKWVDDTLTLRENTMPGYFDDNWGGGA